ncbi:DUF5680 domain-containing protein [Sporolactobacillus shoreicorticis]|uniref:DUF5680 domain-containing protein n=1 Tax=Sporolactobacillus shoreicorticis TaxID=1923877 RepID=A0ABW5S0X0_9BACL|nr:DUF5680 domain-containing protein [Sporolactobacillus shoreicorticis]MCO7125252.1 DUF5680 domain-containing protein [Sporolactobacillus shoreicorticis]
MISNKIFLDFLLNAKKTTYASQGDEASVIPKLEGSQQLEFQNGDFFYRDIYFGLSYFVGQETVYYQKTPLWSMVYSGGVDNTCDQQATKVIYTFLGKALRQVNLENPYRGPQTFVNGDFIYSDSNEGTLEKFKGMEIISLKDREVYRLNYSGGFIK